MSKTRKTGPEEKPIGEASPSLSSEKQTTEAAAGQAVTQPEQTTHPQPDAEGVVITPVEHPAAELSLEEQLQATRTERDVNCNQLLRARAELENFRKRVQKENEQLRLYQSLSLIRDLLPILDNLQRALEAAANASTPDELVQGVEMVAKQTQDVLARHAAVPIDAIGQAFDPNLHEALQQVPSEDHPAMTVLEEIERGYTLHDRVVRPSKVIVSSGPPE